MIERYTSTTGEVIEYPTPSPETAAFLRRAIAAANDPSVTEGELLELLYGRENPILAQGIFPGRGAVTKAVLADPLYAVIVDLQQQKAVLAGSFVAERDAKPYTLTVAEAAERIGISPDAVRKAIRAARLSALRVDGEYRIAPNDADVYRDHVVPRGSAEPRPTVTQAIVEVTAGAPALVVRCGSAPGRSLRIKADTRVQTTGKKGGVVDAIVQSFAEAIVATSGATTNHAFILQASRDTTRIEWGPFFVEGRFKVVDTIRDAKLASETFKRFDSILDSSLAEAITEFGDDWIEGTPERRSTFDAWELFAKENADLVEGIPPVLVNIARRRVREAADNNPTFEDVGRFYGLTSEEIRQVIGRLVHLTTATPQTFVFGRDGSQTESSRAICDALRARQQQKLGSFRAME